MKNNTRKTLGLTDENITFPEDWLEDAKIKGVTKGLNNKIKLIKRISYGYRNFYHLRDRIYIIQDLIFSPTEDLYE